MFENRWQNNSYVYKFLGKFHRVSRKGEGNYANERQEYATRIINEKALSTVILMATKLPDFSGLRHSFY